MYVCTVTDFIFLSSKITVTRFDWSHEIKKYLLLGRKGMTKLDIVLRPETSFLTKLCIIKAMVFPVATYRSESWTIKKAECLGFDAFKLWLRRLLRVPWTPRRSNQSVLKEINPEYS